MKQNSITGLNETDYPEKVVVLPKDKLSKYQKELIRAVCRVGSGDIEKIAVGLLELKFCTPATALDVAVESGIMSDGIAKGVRLMMFTESERKRLLDIIRKRQEEKSTDSGDDEMSSKKRAEDQNNALVSLYAEGHTYKEIGEKLGLSEKTVQKRAAELRAEFEKGFEGILPRISTRLDPDEKVILYDDNDMNGDDCKFYACKSRYQIPQRGYWTEKNWRQRSTMFVCSVCGETAYDRPLGSAKHVGKKICKLKYCPNCGAEMNGMVKEELQPLSCPSGILWLSLRPPTSSTFPIRGKEIVFPIIGEHIQNMNAKTQRRRDNITFSLNK